MGFKELCRPIIIAKLPWGHEYSDQESESTMLGLVAHSAGGGMLSGLGLVEIMAVVRAVAGGREQRGSGFSSLREKNQGQTEARTKRNQT